MDGDILYQRIKQLCAERGLSIRQLEANLHFGNSSIKKWRESSSPSIDKITKVATYFDVSTDYLLGRAEIRGTISEVLQDEDVISFQRARENMTQGDKERMMEMLRKGFESAFSNGAEDNNQT